MLLDSLIEWDEAAFRRFLFVVLQEFPSSMGFRNQEQKILCRCILIVTLMIKDVWDWPTK